MYSEADLQEDEGNNPDKEVDDTPDHILGHFNPVDYVVQVS